MRLLIIPESGVFDPADLPGLVTWVRDGGVLVITGKSGSRLGERDNFDLSTTNALSALAGTSQEEPQNARAIGQGHVLRLREDPGVPYYEASEKRGEMLERFAKIPALAGLGKETLSLSASTVPPTVGLTLYQSAGRVFVDVNNTEIDLKTDALRETLPMLFSVALPPELRGRKLSIRIVSPGEAPQAEISHVQGDRVEIKLGPVLVYASVLVEPAKD